MNYYEILGIPCDAELNQIKKAYRELAHAHHPDVSPDTNDSRMAEINEAYETLKNPDLKQIYDLNLKEDNVLDNNAVDSARSATGTNPTHKLMRAEDTIHEVLIDVEDAYYGCTLQISNINIKNHKYSTKKNIIENVILEVPAGTLSGEIFIFKNKGGWAWNGQARSDLIIKVQLTDSDEL